jgi:hypothetical protein
MEYSPIFMLSLLGAPPAPVTPRIMPTGRGGCRVPYTGNRGGRRRSRRVSVEDR